MAWADMRRRASSSAMPRRSTSRRQGHLLRAVDDDHAGHVVAVAAARLHQQRHVQDDDGADAGIRASWRATSARTAGWTMALRSARAEGSENTTSASARRSEASAGAEPGHQRVVGGAAVSHHRTGHHVGVDDHRAPRRQQSGDGGLAGSDPAREPDNEHRAATVSLRPIRPNGQLFSTRPEERLTAARAANKRVRKGLAEKVKDWPSSSPGCLNPWLLLVTTKEPVWRDPYITWEELPLTLGTAHQGFFYPDPMGFFAEIRRWAVELFRLVEPRWTAPDALALTTLVHASRGKEHLDNAIEAFQPKVILFLDEPSWQASGLEVDRDRPLHQGPPPARSRSTRASGA